MGPVLIPFGLPLGVELLNQLGPVILGELLTAEGANRPLRRLKKGYLLPQKFHLRFELLIPSSQLRYLRRQLLEALLSCLSGLFSLSQGSQLIPHLSQLSLQGWYPLRSALQLRYPLLSDLLLHQELLLRLGDGRLQLTLPLLQPHELGELLAQIIQLLAGGLQA